jgi:uncharacterized Fe-S cluster-containing radical SAM superfamily protein
LQFYEFYEFTLVDHDVDQELRQELDDSREILISIKELFQLKQLLLEHLGNITNNDQDMLYYLAGRLNSEVLSSLSDSESNRYVKLRVCPSAEFALALKPPLTLSFSEKPVSEFSSTLLSALKTLTSNQTLPKRLSTCDQFRWIFDNAKDILRQTENERYENLSVDI